MLKNRDTASNPYRVPPQPTPMWIKVCISCLLVCVLALMGAVIFLMMVPQCTQICESPPTEGVKTQPFRDGSRREVAMADQGSKQQATKQNDGIKLIVERVTELTATVYDLQSRVSRISSTQERVEASSGRSSHTSLTTPELASLRKIPQLESFARNLDAKLTRHINGDQEADSGPVKYPKPCKSGHYRFGVHCYVVADARLSQIAAKNWCEQDFGDQASLAIIKDRLTQDFISSKLADRLRTYWIGIERQSDAPGSYASYPSSTMASLAPTAVRSGQFEYNDGTRVQRNVWQMWRPVTSTDDVSSAQSRDCAQLTYDRTTSQWRWEEKLCSDRTGYICQYYIMTS